MNFASRLIVGLLAVLQLMLVFYHRPPDFDERASLDISLGIRPNIVTDKNGVLTTDLEYDKIIEKKQFLNSDYTRLRTPVNVLHSVMKDNSNSFIYYLLLQKWSLIFGVGITKMRIFSLITSWLSLTLLFKIIRQLLPEQPQMPWIAVVLLFSNPFFIASSCAIRAYALCTLFTLLSIKILISTRENRDNAARYIAFIVFACLAVLCHYFILAVIIPLIILAGSMIMRRKQRVREKASLLGCLLIICLTSVAWIQLCKPEGLFWLQQFNTALKLTSAGTAYSFNVTNLLRQLFQVAGIVIAPAGKLTELPLYIRATYQVIAIGILLAGVLLIRKHRNSSSISTQNKKTLFHFGIAPLLLYIAEAIWAGQLTIFLPHHSVLLLPGIYIGLIVLTHKLVFHSKTVKICKTYLIYIISGNILAVCLIIYNNSDSLSLDRKKSEVLVGKIKNTQSWNITLESENISVSSMERIAAAVAKNEKIKSITFEDAEDAQRLNYFLHSDRISQTIKYSKY